ncbi:MAG: sel1 repeat family protein [Burkholderiales bacterium]|nr:sel1 repeat family protein [Burkholderiales bacterium]
MKLIKWTAVAIAAIAIASGVIWVTRSPIDSDVDLAGVWSCDVTNAKLIRKLSLAVAADRRLKVKWTPEYGVKLSNKELIGAMQVTGKDMRVELIGLLTGDALPGSPQSDISLFFTGQLDSLSDKAFNWPRVQLSNVNTKVLFDTDQMPLGLKCSRINNNPAVMMASPSPATGSSQLTVDDIKALRTSFTNNARPGRTEEKDGNIFYSSDKQNLIQITSTGRDRDPTVMKSGAVAFVRDQSKADGILMEDIVLVDGGQERRLFASKEDPDPKNNLRGLRNLFFGDEDSLYFETAGWSFESPAIQMLKISTGEVRFVGQGKIVAVGLNGKYANYLVFSETDSEGESDPPKLVLVAPNGQRVADVGTGPVFWNKPKSPDLSKELAVIALALIGADFDDAESQYQIANRLHYGNTLPTDLSEAFKWYQSPAEKGHALANNALGVMYYKGEGVKKDVNKAAKYFLVAANKGYSIAQENVGTMYEDGIGTKKNYEEAKKWYEKAASQGRESAKRRLQSLALLDLPVMKGWDGLIETLQKSTSWQCKNLQRAVVVQRDSSLKVLKGVDPWAPNSQPLVNDIIRMQTQYFEQAGRLSCM